MTRETFRDGMKLLAAAWPDRSPSAQTNTAYWMACAHLDDGTWGDAIRRCLRECRFYPQPAEILQRAADALADAGLLPDDPEAAWGRVLSAARGWHPARAADDWDNPDLARTLGELGGLRAVALAADDDVAHLRRAFVARYGEYRRRRLASDLSLLAQPLPAPLDVPLPVTAGAGR